MIPVLFKEDEQIFTHNGIGALYESLSCDVIEEENGAFTMELEYPVDGELFSEIKDFRIIQAKPNDIDDPHNFRIYEIEKSIDDLTVYVRANTRTNDLGNNLITDYKGKDVTPQQAMNGLKNNLIEPTNFDLISDIQTKSNVEWTRINPLNAIVGVRGSMVDIWGGQIKRTNTAIHLYSRRGRDNVVTIRPGKNIEGLNMTVSTAGLVTKILPTFTYRPVDVPKYQMVSMSDGTTEKRRVPTSGSTTLRDDVTVIGDVVSSQHVDNYPTNYWASVDYGEDDELKNKIDIYIDTRLTAAEESPTILDMSGFENDLKNFVKDELDKQAKQYFTHRNPGVDKPTVRIKVDMLQLSDSPDWEEFKDLERIGLTDTLDVWVEEYDIDVEVRVTSLTYESIAEHVISFNAGSDGPPRQSAIEKKYDDLTKATNDYITSFKNGVQNIMRNTADGLNRKFEGYTEPPAELSSEGDIWFKQIGEGKVEIWIHDGVYWQPLMTEDFGKQLEADIEAVQSELDVAKLQAVADSEQALVDAKAHAEAEDARIRGELESDIGGAITLAEQAKADAVAKANQALIDAKAHADAEIALIETHYDDILEVVESDVADAKQTADDAMFKIDNDIADKFTSLDAEILSIETISNTAQANAQTAINNSIEALGDASTALTNAQTALNQSQDALGDADTALTNAQTALNRADTAIGSASNAATLAGNAVSKADDAQALATNLSGQVSGFETTVAGFNQTVNSYTGQVSGFRNDILGLESTVANYETEVDQFGNAVSTYATEVSTMRNTVSGFESTVATYGTEVSGLAGEVMGYKNQVSTFNNTVSGFNSVVTQVQSDLDNLEIGGRNLIPAFTDARWEIPSSMSIEGGYVLSQPGTHPATIDIDVETNTEYTYTFNSDYARSSIAGYIDGILNENIFGLTTGSFVRTFNSGDNNQIRIHISKYSQEDRTATTRNLKLEKGNIATDWTPAPEDTASVSRVSILENTIDGLNHSVAEYETELIGYRGDVTQYKNQVSTMTNAVDGFNSTVTQYTTEVDEFGNEVDSYATQVSNFSNTVSGFESTVATYGQEVNSLTGEVSTYATEVSTLTNTVSGFQSKVTKVEQDYAEVSGTVATHTSQISNLDGEIALKANTTTVNSLTGRVSTAETSITANTTAIGLKANTTTVNALTGRVSTAETSITANANAIKLKASQSSVDSLTGRVNTAETSITANANAIKLKASQSSVDSLTGRVNTAETSITANATAIGLKADTTTVNALTGTVNTLSGRVDVTAGQISSKVWNTDIQTAVDGIDGRNYLRNSDFSLGSEFWSGDGSLVDGGLLLEGISGPSSLVQNMTVIPEGEYTLQVWYEVLEGQAPYLFNNGGSDAQMGNAYPFEVDKEYFEVGITIRTSNLMFAFRYAGSSPANHLVGKTLIKRVKLEKGNRTTDWTPAPEDTTDLINHVESELTQKHDSITASVSSIDGRVATNKLNLDGLTTTVQGVRTDLDGTTTLLNTTRTTVSGHTSSISTLRTDVNGKATTAQFNTLNSTVNGTIQRVGTAEGKITTIETNVSGLQTTVAGKAAQSQVTQLANAVDTKVTSSQVSSLIKSDKTIKDTRDDNETPSWYQSNYPRETVREFKRNSTVGISGEGSYGVLETKVPWANSSGGGIKQTFTTDYAVHERSGSAAGTTWNKWKKTADVDWVGAQVTVLENNINLRVSKNDVINQINVSTEGILIDGNKTHITGTTTIDNGVIKNAHIGDLNASKINAGTINAARLNSAAIVTAGLAANVVKSTHIETSTATVDKIFANETMINRLTAKTAFINSIKAVNIDAARITTGTINAARLNASAIVTAGLSANVVKAAHIHGDTALFDKLFSTTSATDRLSARTAWIKNGMFTNASISGARIQDATIASGKIASLDAGKISTGTLDGIAITGVTITGSTFIQESSVSGSTFGRWDRTGITLKDSSGTMIMDMNREGINFHGSSTETAGTYINNNLIDVQKANIYDLTVTGANANLRSANFTGNIHVGNSSAGTGHGVRFTGTSIPTPLDRMFWVGYGYAGNGAYHYNDNGWRKLQNELTSASDLTINKLTVSSIVDSSSLQLTKRLRLQNAGLQFTGGSLPSVVDRQMWIGYGYSNNGIYVSLNGNWYKHGETISDARLKENIVDTEIDSLSAIASWNFVEFEWKDSDLGSGQQFGLLAQNTSHIANYYDEVDRWEINSGKQTMMNSHAIQQLAIRELNTNAVASQALQLGETNEEKIKRLEKRIEELESVL